MTAEIAILNKSAVALAADSAVTISAGSDQKKVFDTADKLFELSCADPIAIMLNNDMNFMETPIPILIKSYRSQATKFDTVSQAADGFLGSLQFFGESAPQSVSQRQLANQVGAIVAWIQSECDTRFREKIYGSNAPTDAEGYQRLNDDTVEFVIGFFAWMINRAQIANFVGQNTPVFSDLDVQTIRSSIDSGLSMANDAQRKTLLAIFVSGIGKIWPFQSPTGIVISGFGNSELFPKLHSFDLYGMVGGVLKYRVGQFVDIDRNGTKAKVMPFAQREMVERFVSGSDSTNERLIKQLCQKMLPKIRSSILGKLDLDEDTLAELTQNAEQAEAAFLDGLSDDGFDAIRQRSQDEIEDMVEFMPKPEMARMAEALVNLTSIKRRVSEGMETVGGPIDVAVVSKAEGFVWVKRKHYFPAELNARYFERINMPTRPV